MINPVAVNLLSVMPKAPSEGTELLASMLNAGHVSLDAQVDADGMCLLEGIHDQFLIPKRGYSPSFSNAFQAMFSPDGAEQWKRDGLFRPMFATRHHATWFPIAVLATYEKIAQSMPAALGLAKLRRDADAWVGELLPMMPADFWTDPAGAGELMGQAMELDFNITAHAAWGRSGPMALDAAGLPVLLRCTRAEHMARALKQDPGVFDRTWDGKPVWQVCVSRLLLDQSRPDNAFVRAFEDWFINNPRPDFAPTMAHLAQTHASRPGRYRSEQWVALLRHCGQPWERWSLQGGAGTGRPLWEQLLLRAKPAAPIFAAFEADPALVQRLPPARFAYLKQLGLLRDITSPPKGQSPPTPAQTDALLRAIDLGQPPAVDPTNTALSALVSQVINKGWQPARSALVTGLQIPLEKLDMGTARILARLGALDPDAWWGPGDQMHAVAKERVSSLFSRSTPPDRAQLDAWAALHEGAPSPWFHVARGVALAIRGGSMSSLIEIDRHRAGQLMEMVGGKDFIDRQRLRFAGKRRAMFDTWVAAIQLESATAPTATDARRSPRF